MHASGRAGLWFAGGSFSQCRTSSRFIVLQIDAIEGGRLEKSHVTQNGLVTMPPSARKAAPLVALAAFEQT